MSTTIHTIHASDLRSGFADAIKMVKKTKCPLIVKQRNVPSCVLVDIDEYEDFLDLKNPRLAKSVAKARKESKEGKVLTFDAVFGGL